MELLVGTDSTWSLRAWICIKMIGLDVPEIVINLNTPNFKAKIEQHSPAGLVPALLTDSIIIHDSLSIIEHLNELSGGSLYPENADERALARSLCCELHAGFTALRTACPFTLDPVIEPVAQSKEIEAELARVKQIFEKAHLPYMFESSSVVDAFYSILAYRLNVYGIELEGKAGQYQHELLNWMQLQKAIAQARSWAAK